MDQILATKAGALAIVFISALIPGMLPLILRPFLLNSKKFSEETASIILSCSLCCGAGVLMATVFLHILAEAREGLTSLGEYSFAELVMVLGFFLVYLVEELTFLWVFYRQKSNSETQLSQFRRTYSSHRLSMSKMMNSPPSSLDAENKSTPNSSNNNDSSKRDTPCTLHAPIGEPEAPSQLSVPNPFKKSPTDTPLNADQISLLRSMIVVAALSLHGALEGLALGLEDEVQNVWLLCLALSAHKIFIGFSIGMEMLEEGTRRSLYLFHICIFSLASPIGGTVGIVLVQNLETNSTNGQITVGVLQAVSAGAILYVVFCEVLEREREKDKGRMLQLLSVVIGFAIMALLGARGHSHSHSEVGAHDHGAHSPLHANLGTPLELANGTFSNHTMNDLHDHYGHNQDHDKHHYDHKDHLQDHDGHFQYHDGHLQDHNNHHDGHKDHLQDHDGHKDHLQDHDGHLQDHDDHLIDHNDHVYDHNDHPSTLHKPHEDSRIKNESLESTSNRRDHDHQNPGDEMDQLPKDQDHNPKESVHDHDHDDHRHPGEHQGHQKTHEH